MGTHSPHRGNQKSKTYIIKLLRGTYKKLGVIPDLWFLATDLVFGLRFSVWKIQNQWKRILVGVKLIFNHHEQNPDLFL